MRKFLLKLGSSGNIELNRSEDVCIYGCTIMYVNTVKDSERMDDIVIGYIFMYHF